MKSRTRLTLLFTLITATILLIFAAVIYVTAKENREQEFFALLKTEAITKANLYLNASVDKQTLQNIYKNNRKVLNEVEVAIYNPQFKLLYHDAVDIDFVKETQAMIDEINQKGEIKFYQDNWQVIGLRYKFENKNYIITAAAFDQYGYNKLHYLLKSSIVIFIISILFIYIAGLFISKKAFDPVKGMIDEAKKIKATNLDLRLKSNGKKDELSELANTFNEMLNRLEKSFDAQKHFVSNISHEIRTPLAAIIAELELSIHKEKSIDEYKSAIHNALADAQRLKHLSNSLLDFAKANYDSSEISFKHIRLDEVLLDAMQQVQKANKEYKIDIHFDAEFLNEDNDDLITINGNEYLLKVAFVNLLENGCKFSPEHKCQVSLLVKGKNTSIRFIDNGIGISTTDLPKIFDPFYRGTNKEFSDGNGIGLSLTKKIIELHSGSISVTSKTHIGTTFSVNFTHI